MTTITRKELSEAYFYHMGDEILKLNNKAEFNNNEQLKPLLEALGVKKISIDYEKFKKLRKIYDLYLDLLGDFLIKNDSKINNLLVYESPRDKYFLEVQDNNNKSNYYRTFLDQENEKRLGHYQLWEKQSVFHKIKLFNQFNLFFDQQSSENEFVNNILNILHSGIVFIDLMIIPVDLKKSRAEWCVKSKYKIENKRLTVHLLDFALIHLYSKMKDKGNKNPFAKNCQIAIGTPLNTSVSIFEHYMDQYLVLPGDDNLKVDISRLNSPSAFIKTVAEGTTFPLFKANAVGSGNGPTRAMVKNAFNI